MMKNKLYKYNHKAFYYIARKTLFTTALILGLSVAVGLPTTINLLTTHPSPGLAEGNSSEMSEVIDSEESLELDIISIQQD